MKYTNSIERTAAMTATMMTLLVTAGAVAQVHPEKPTWEYEKCHGVARAAKNDCFTARNSCAGTSKTDGQRDAWIYLPAGTCEKIAGGSLKPAGE